MRMRAKMQDDLNKKVEIPKDSFDIINDSVPEEPQVPEIVQNDEISINYVMNHKYGTKMKSTLTKLLHII